MGLFSKTKDETGDETGDEIHLACGEVLDISRAADFHQELKAALGKGSVVVLDGAEIERIDAAALQLCAAFFHDAAARKLKAKWLSPSEPLLRAAGLLGLLDRLGLPNGN